MNRIPRLARSTLRTSTFKFIFAASLIALAFSATYTSSTAAFSELDFRQIVLFGMAVNAVLLIVALLLRSRVIVNAVLSLVVLAGVVTAYVIHTDLYLDGNRAVLVLLCVAAVVGLFVAFRVIDETRWGGAALSAVTLLTLGIVAVVHLNSTGSVKGDTSNIRAVAFQETPNLYFVSFDAIAPRVLLNKYFDIETTEFHDVFEAHFRRFPNFFANSVRTKHSLNTLLALDPDVYSSLQRELSTMGADPDPSLFSGQNPSPMLGILHENGYETTSIYVDSYFGRRKGPYIDHYVTFEKNTACNLLDDNIRDISFWGYCRFFDGSYDWDNRLTAEQITKASDNDGPQFVIAHLYQPGHADRSFKYADAEQLEKFRATYLRESENAASNLELIIRHLAENDPNAILLVYGDHGALLSDGLDFEDNPEFIVQDNYGVLGGVYPRDTCSAWFDEASTQGYMTVLDAVHAILRCLSGGESALIEPREYTQPAYGPIPWDDRRPYFKEFLYE